MIILVLFLHIHRGLKIPSLHFATFSVRDAYFQLQTRSVEFKGGFPRYFCTKLQRPRRRCRVSPSPIILSSSYSLLEFSSLFLPLFLSVYLSFLFRHSLRVRPCNVTTLPISSSRDHLLLRPLLGPVRPKLHGKSCAIGIPSFINFSNRFEMMC